MKKALSILFIALFSIIQVGSVGLSLYQTKCLKNNLVTYTFKDVGCCCKKNEATVSSTKSCCSSNKKSCCSGSSCDADAISKKCCDSESLLYQIIVSPYETIDDYESASLAVQTVSIVLMTNYSATFSPRLNDEVYNQTDPPPLINFDRRLLMQSFQI